MVLNTKRMTGVTVRTKSGTVLGKLASIDIDGDTGKLAFVRAIPRGAVVGLLAKELVITWQEIISMDEKEVVVSDAFVPERTSMLAQMISPTPEVSGTHFRDA